MSEQDSKINQHNVLQHNAELTFQQIVEYTIDMNNKKSHVIKCLAEVNTERKWLNEMTKNIEMELSEAKPALEAAHKAVSRLSNVFKPSISTPRIRSPPKLVEMTMKAVACVLNNRLLKGEIVTAEMKMRARILVSGFARLSFVNMSNDLIDLILMWHSIRPKRKYSHFKSSTWYQLEKLIRYNQYKFFLQSILKFDQNDANRITSKTRKYINKQYLSNEEFNFERVNKASKVCGPLVIWVKSQVKYAHLLESVEPMQQEIKQLSNKLNEKLTQCQQFNMIIKELQGKIKVCKLKYADLTKKALQLNIELDNDKNSVAAYLNISNESNDIAMTSVTQYNEQNQFLLLLVTGFIRQNLFLVDIPNNIPQILYMYLQLMKLEYDNTHTNSEEIFAAMIETTVNLCETKQELTRICAECDEELKSLNEKNKLVEAELAEVTALLDSAQQQLKFLNKRSKLIHYAALRRPPKFVEMTMKAVATLTCVGYSRHSTKCLNVNKFEKDKKIAHILIYGFIRIESKALKLNVISELIDLVITFYEIRKVYIYYYHWKDMQKMLRSNTFMESLLKFDAGSVKCKTLKLMKEYLSNEEFVFEKVNLRSSVCGVLIPWVKAEVKYAHVLDDIEPMTKEIKELKQKLSEKQQHRQMLIDMIDKAERKIEKYKEKYKQMVKNEMSSQI